MFYAFGLLILSTFIKPVFLVTNGLEYKTVLKGGKAIIAMPSTTRHGNTKIVPFLKEGAGVTTTRAHVHYIATEYGVVDLFGLNLKQRANALISIAHPDHREQLDKEAFTRFKANC